MFSSLIFFPSLHQQTMEQSIPNFAKEALSTLKNSFFQGRGGYYAQMDQESENEDDGNDNTMSHSLFYSIHQNRHNINEDSIPLTESNAYSDRSQLLFEQEDDADYDDSDLQESPVSFEWISYNDLCINKVKRNLQPSISTSLALLHLISQTQGLYQNRYCRQLRL